MGGDGSSGGSRTGVGDDDAVAGGGAASPAIAGGTGLATGGFFAGQPAANIATRVLVTSAALLDS